MRDEMSRQRTVSPYFHRFNYKIFTKYTSHDISTARKRTHAHRREFLHRSTDGRTILTPHICHPQSARRTQVGPIPPAEGHLHDATAERYPAPEACDAPHGPRVDHPTPSAHFSAAAYSPWRCSTRDDTHRVPPTDAQCMKTSSSPQGTERSPGRNPSRRRPQPGSAAIRSKAATKRLPAGPPPLAPEPLQRDAADVREVAPRRLESRNQATTRGPSTAGRSRPRPPPSLASVRRRRELRLQPVERRRPASSISRRIPARTTSERLA